MGLLRRALAPLKFPHASLAGLEPFLHSLVEPVNERLEGRGDSVWQVVLDDVLKLGVIAIFFVLLKFFLVVLNHFLLESLEIDMRLH